MNKPFLEKKVLITGGLGFIGASLARSLVKMGADVICLDNLYPSHGGNLFNVHDIQDKISIIRGDVRDRSLMDRAIKDKHFLFNLAGQTSHLDSMIDPRADLEINAEAQLSILESCRKHNPDIRVLFASTRQIYGKPDYLPVDENHPIRPVDVNGINKLSGEMYHILYHKVYGIRATALRLTNSYGPGMRIKDARQTFLGVWIKAVLNDDPFFIYGEGSQLRDFNYIDDVVRALLLVAVGKRTYGEVYNLGGEEIVSLRDLAELLINCAKSGQYKFVSYPPESKAIDIGDYYGNYKKLTDATRWKPSIALVDGLMKTLSYYREHQSHYL